MSFKAVFISVEYVENLSGNLLNICSENSCFKTEARNWANGISHCTISNKLKTVLYKVCVSELIIRSLSYVI